MATEVKYTLSLQDLLTGKLNQANDSANKFESTIGNVQTKLNGMAAAVGVAFSAAAVIAFGNKVFDVTRQVDALKVSLNQISGGQAEQTFEYLTDFSNKLGVNLESAAKGYKTIGAAARGTSLEGENLKNIFESVTEASAVYGLTAYETEGALLAISQMISKGTVSAEELRGQLGERLAGAFQIASRAMGVTTAQLGKMMEKGEVVATDFLPKFAAQLRQEVAGGLPAAMTGLNAELARSQNQMFLLQQQIGNDLRPAFVAILEGVQGLIGAFKDAWEWGGKNADVLKTLGVAVGVATGAYVAYRLAVLGSIAIQGIQTAVTYIQIAAMYTLGTSYETAGVATKLLAAAQYGLNAAFAANPIGLVITAIAALAAGIYYAYQRFGVFRGVVWATWGVLKEFAAIVTDIFTGLATTIKGVLTFNPEMIKDGATQTIAAYRDAAYRIGRAAKEGYEAGMADFNKGQGDGLENAITKQNYNAPKTTKGATPATTATVKEPKSATGQKNVTINVTIGNLVKDFTVKTTNIQEGASKVREMVAQTLLSATNDSQLLAGQ